MFVDLTKLSHFKKLLVEVRVTLPSNVHEEAERVEQEIDAVLSQAVALQDL